MQVFKDLWSYILGQKRLLIISVLSLLIYAGTSIFPAVYIKNVIDKLEASSQIPPSRFLWFALALLILFAIRGITFVGQKYFINKIMHNALSNLRMRMFEQLSHLSVSYFDKTDSGDIISYFSNDIRSIERSLIILISNPVRDCFQLLALLGIMISRSWSLFLLIIVLLPIAPAVLSYFNNKNRKISREKQNMLSTVTRNFYEVLQALPIIRSFNTEAIEKEKFNQRNQTLFQLFFNALRILAFSMSFLEMIWAFYALVVLLYGGYLIIHHHITIGDFASFILSFFLVVEPIKNMNGFMLKFEDGISASKRVQDFFNTPIEANEQTAKLPLMQKKIHVKINSFSYKDKETGEPKTVLQDIDIVLKKGETTALVGASGSGKTTIGNLILRFYQLDKEEGKILFDGHNIAEHDIHSLRSQISLVTQESIILNDTIYNNIAYSNKEATKEQVEEAAKKAYIDRFISNLPDGYQTMAGEYGSRLSGGQKQRIVIARAILKNAPILILDEATSALDRHSEVVIQQALDNLLHGHTCLVIAHRLSTIRNANKIYVLKQGRIVEEGTHTQLLEQDNEYTKLYNQ